MSSDAQAILTQNVEQITNFTMTENQWSADFFLDKKQVFHVLSDPSGYLYQPDPNANQIPDLKQIHWKIQKRGFGGCGCGFDTEVQVIGSSSQKEAYEQILTPTVRHYDYWVPYPEYNYVPMLLWAFRVNHAWNQSLKYTRLKNQADHNLADVLTLQKATYQLERN
ncbi:MAG: hypothetical protein IJV07_03720 [Alphaproteobacteria bacterium]|nr:hypothetical protein [Alphaproteobacteria bacterium]